MSNDDRGMGYHATVGQWQQFDSITHKDKHMKISDMTESKYLKQSDVPDEQLVTVRKLTKVNVARDDEDPEYRWTVTFAEFTKPMVLNATNIKRMGKALGDDTDEWINGQVVVYVDHEVEYAGQTVGGLRVRAAKSKVAPRQVRSVDSVNSDLRAEDPPF